MECQPLLFITYLKGRENQENKISFSFPKRDESQFPNINQSVSQSGGEEEMTGEPSSSSTSQNYRELGTLGCWLDFPSLLTWDDRAHQSETWLQAPNERADFFVHELPNKHFGDAPRWVNIPSEGSLPKCEGRQKSQQVQWYTPAQVHTCSHRNAQDETPQVREWEGSWMALTSGKSNTWVINDQQKLGKRRRQKQGAGPYRTLDQSKLWKKDGSFQNLQVGEPECSLC